MTSSTTPTRNQVGRPKVPLTDPEAIVSTAFKIVDSEGFQALTTRRLGRELGVTGAAIYGHFRTMEQLHVEIIRSLSQRVAPVNVDNPDWKGEILEFALRAFKVCLESPNVQEIWSPQIWLEVVPKAHTKLAILLRKGGVKPSKIHAFQVSWESIQHGFVRTYAHYCKIDSSPKEEGEKSTSIEYRRRRMIEQYSWAIKSLLDSLERGSH